MFIKRALWALPIVLIVAGCGGGSSPLVPNNPSNSGEPAGHIAYVQQGQIVVEGTDRAATDIFVRRADGEGLAQLSAGTNQPFNFEPAISPNGQRVAFVASSGGRLRNAIYVVGINGTGLRRLFEIGATVDALSWTPDGTNLIYASAAPSSNDSFGPSLIYRARADGSGAPQLVFGDGKSRREPALAPDGRTLAYLSDVGAGIAEVFVSRLDGAGAPTGTERQLTADQTVKGQSVFAPDGRRLFYAISPPSVKAGPQYSVVPLDGSSAPEPAISADDPVGLAFSPDGQYIAFGSSNYNGGINPAFGGTRILITRADGSGAARLLSGNLEGGAQSDPSWGR